MSSLGDEPTVENFRRETWTLKDARKVTVTRSSTVARRWRFCAGGGRVTVLPFEATGQTTSLDSIVECESLEHAVKVIQGKGLAVPDVDSRQWNQLLADNGLPHDPAALEPPDTGGIVKKETP